MMMMMRSERVASNARSLVSHFGPGVSAPALNIKPPPPSLANNLRPAVLVKMQTSFSFYGRKWRRKKKRKKKETKPSNDGEQTSWGTFMFVSTMAADDVTARCLRWNGDDWLVHICVSAWIAIRVIWAVGGLYFYWRALIYFQRLGPVV